MTIDPSQSDQSEESDEGARHNRGCPPPSPEECQRRWAAWHQAMELSHAMLMMGLRQRIGPDGDLRAAYRDWYERYQALKWARMPPSLIFKAASGRLIDLADIKTLVALHERTLDYDYMHLKANELRLPSQFWRRTTS